MQAMSQIGNGIGGGMGRLAMIPAVNKITINIVRNMMVFGDVLEILGISHEPVVDDHVAMPVEVVEDVVEGEGVPDSSGGVG